MIILLVIMSMAVITDIRFYKIPNSYILIGTVIGFAVRFTQEGFMGILIACISAVILFSFLLPFFMIHGIGAGDIKLFCMMAVYMDMKRTVQCFLMTFIIAALMSIMKMLWTGVFIQRILKLFYYMQAMYLTQSYREYEQKEYMKAKENIIRMSIPALMSVVILLVKDRMGVCL